MLPDPRSDENGVPLPVAHEEPTSGQPVQPPAPPRVIEIDIGGVDDDDEPPRGGSVIEIDLVEP